MSAVALAKRRSIQDEWADQAICVLVARARTAAESAHAYMAAHAAATQQPPGPALVPGVSRQAAELHRHFAGLVRARLEMRDTLTSLSRTTLADDLSQQVRAVELSCADLDDYIERYTLASTAG